MDFPAIPPNQESCVVQAAAHYRAHPDLVRAVLRTENGTRGEIRKNKDGSFDMGPMQINSVHLPNLAKFGITKDMLVNDECLNIHIGTYLLQKHIVTAPDVGSPLGFWRAVGKYHSATPEKNAEYQKRVWRNLNQLRMGASYGR